MKVNMLEPIGFCYGVTNAIKLAINIKQDNKNKNVYIFGYLIHNEVVIDELTKEGIISIDTTKINDKEEYLKRFNSNDVVIFTAHGVNNRYIEILNKNHVTNYETTCSYVTMTHEEILTALHDNKEVIYIGKGTHQETLASMSLSNHNLYLYDLDQASFDYSKVKTDNPVVLNQTTLSILELKSIHEEIKKHFKKATFIDEICKNTTLRQTNLLKDDSKPDLVLVVGSKLSNNTDKLYEIAKKKYSFAKVYKVNYLEDVEKIDLTNIKETLLTSGTSASLKTIYSIKNYLEGIN